MFPYPLSDVPSTLTGIKDLRLSKLKRSVLLRKLIWLKLEKKCMDQLSNLVKEQFMRESPIIDEEISVI